MTSSIFLQWHKHNRFIPLILLAVLSLTAIPAMTQNVVIYSNQFNTPIATPTMASCQLDFAVNPVNDLWAGTGLGVSSGQFVNTLTVETILITGPADVYDDPSGIGGDYSIGMLRTIWGDKLGLLIDTQELPYVNLNMDISSINTTCGGPLQMDTAVFLIELLDAPGGIFDLSNGVVLDADTLTGIGANEDSFVFNWANVGGSLDASGSTDNMVALRMTLIRSSYASFDNIYIEASQDTVITNVNDAVSQPLLAFPIPCKDELTIHGLAADNQTVNVFSMLGCLIATKKPSLQGTINVSELAPGAYMILVGEGSQLQTIRFIKE